MTNGRRKTGVFTRLWRLATGKPTVGTEECTAQLQRALDDLRQKTEDMRQTVIEAKRAEAARRG